MSEVSVVAMGPGQFEVQVTEGATTTTHQVSVSPEMTEELGGGIDQEELVRASFDFLLEREPATSILREFSLDVIPQYFPDYREEILRRLQS